MNTIKGARNEHAGVAAAQKEGASDVDPDATEEPGVRSWLGDLGPGAARYAAAFDTRLDRSPLLTGAASRGIARRLRRHGFDVIATESFLVEGSEGPLEAGELERARAWGAKLAKSVPAVAAAAEG